MAKRIKPTALGSGGTGIGVLWGIYSSLTTARDIPKDAGWLAIMLADPPIYLPWLIAALSIALVIWAIFWPSNDNESDTVGTSTSGNASPIIQQNHAGTGHNIGQVGNLIVGQPKLEMTPALISEIAQSLDVSKPVAIVWRNKGRGSELATLLKTGLEEKGFTLGIQMGFGEITGVEFESKITISPNGFQFGGMSIAGGQQAVAIEPSA